MSSGGGCDAHFIVHLFVTAIADGKMQPGSMVPKTWDVLQQVTLKLSTLNPQPSTLGFRV